MVSNFYFKETLWVQFPCKNNRSDYLTKTKWSAYSTKTFHTVTEKQKPHSEKEYKDKNIEHIQQTTKEI
jgi:hypothetical protein